ncbi:hypothetical protein [Sphingomicrobium aestuariivivum]|uniref:hypothetical protein n=1 Tax=Sphingomicrobium aestuariivivum TaxID=1582356 RepID=UPI001FD6BEBA|nr:hypothetical protein [Sphingomicrobium aestuariivivum]MCJ8191192.1 hypothetical protein [Sphingomicrobium aestuariivivum]
MKKLIALGLALPLMLAACGDADAPENDVEEEAALDQEAAAPAIDLSGEWQVIAHNSVKLPSVFPAIATFDGEGGMTVNSTCVTMNFALNREGNMIAPEFLGKDTSGCGRPQTDGELLIEEVVPQSNILADTGHELMISGPGGTLRLARPAATVDEASSEG